MLEEARKHRWFGLSTLPVAAPTETELRTWFRWRNLDLDPITYWERVKVPVLLIYGEREDRNPVDRSIERIQAALLRAGNTKMTSKIFPDADHGIMIVPNSDARVPRSTEANDGLRFAPGYFDTMTDWLKNHLGLSERKLR